MSKLKKLWKKVKGGVISLVIAEIFAMLMKNGKTRLVLNWGMFGVGIGLLGAGLNGIIVDIRSQKEEPYEQTEEVL